MILTGGEPALQVDRDLIDSLHEAGYKLAIETNGSVELPAGIDWITVSPKVAEHAIRQRRAHEVKYVRGYGQGVPETVVRGGALPHLARLRGASRLPDPRLVHPPVHGQPALEIVRAAAQGLERPVGSVTK